ncbi:MAG: ABC transporter [Acetobacteraceae bacterium]|nr:ABC transporter [Acetobacteraceae bacterium]MSP28889.1 ABC transporter [Acetobacteraceae bacterium]
MQRIWLSSLGVIAAVAIAIGVNLFADAQLTQVRLDLTQQRLYTLSPGTRKILGDLKDPITLRLFYSRKLGSTVPIYGSFADRVQEMLQQYVSLSGGKLKLEIYDPEPFSDTEDRAMALGLQGVPVDQGGEKVYFGLAGSNLLDDERNIGFFQTDRERFLEFDLTKLVYDLSSPTRAVVGLMTGLPVDGDQRQMMMSRGQTGRPWVAMTQLRQTNTVKTVPEDAQVIDADIQVLLVIHPQDLPDTTLYTIDQFVMRGGRLMVMVDPLSEAQGATPGPGGQPALVTGSQLDKLLDAWGVKVETSRAVGDLGGAWRVRANPNDRIQAVDYVAWFNMRDAGINQADPANAEIQQVTVASAGAISKKDGASIEILPLLQSSSRSGFVALDKLRQPDPARILAEFEPAGGPATIAARARGMLKSAFEAAPPAPEGTQRPENFPAHIPATQAPANLVIVADTDLLADRYWVRVQEFFGEQQATPFADNGAFLANVVGTLAGGDALIGLRARGGSVRPFERVDAMQRDAEARFRQTERTLQQSLEGAEKKLRELRQGSTAGGAQASATPQAIITPEQRAAIDALRKEMLVTRQKLRNVQLDLRRDISALQNNLRLFNIVLVPAVLTVLAIIWGITRNRRRARARA